MSEQSSVQPIFTESQLCYFSRQFSNMFGLPVRLYQQQKEIYTYSPVQLAADPVILCIDVLLQETAPLGYFAYHERNTTFPNVNPCRTWNASRTCSIT